MKIIETVALISINETIILQVVSFLLFVALFNRIMIRPTRKTMLERETYMQQMTQDIIEADKAYQELSAQIEAQESDTRQTAFKMRNEIEAAGQSSANEVIDRTKHEIATLKTQARQEAAAKIEAARQQVLSEAESICNRMMETLLGRRI